MEDHRTVLIAEDSLRANRPGTGESTRNHARRVGNRRRRVAKSRDHPRGSWTRSWTCHSHLRAYEPSSHPHSSLARHGERRCSSSSSSPRMPTRLAASARFLARITSPRRPELGDAHRVIRPRRGTLRRRVRSVTRLSPDVLDDGGALVHVSLDVRRRVLQVEHVLHRQRTLRVHGAVAPRAARGRLRHVDDVTVLILWSGVRAGALATGVVHRLGESTRGVRVIVRHGDGLGVAHDARKVGGVHRAPVLAGVRAESRVAAGVRLVQRDELVQLGLELREDAGGGGKRRGRSGEVGAVGCPDFSESFKRERGGNVDVGNLEDEREGARAWTGTWGEGWGAPRSCPRRSVRSPPRPS